MPDQALFTATPTTFCYVLNGALKPCEKGWNRGFPGVTPVVWKISHRNRFDTPLSAALVCSRRTCEKPMTPAPCSRD
jgi:hypothetical protein